MKLNKSLKLTLQRIYEGTLEQYEGIDLSIAEAEAKVKSLKKAKKEIEADMEQLQELLGIEAGAVGIGEDQEEES